MTILQDQDRGRLFNYKFPMNVSMTYLLKPCVKSYTETVRFCEGKL